MMSSQFSAVVVGTEVATQAEVSERALCSTCMTSSLSKMSQVGSENR